MMQDAELLDYLLSQGWTVRYEGLKDRLYVFENTNFPGRQLVYPMDSSAPDYKEAVDRVIEKLSEMTGQRIDEMTIKGDKS